MTSRARITQTLIHQFGLDTGRQAQQAAQREVLDAHRDAAEQRSLSRALRHGGYIAAGTGALVLISGSFLLARALARTSRTSP